MAESINTEYMRETTALLNATVPEAQHSHLVVNRGERGGAEIRRKVVNILQYYERRRWITENQHNAGDRLCKDYYYAGIYCPKGFEMREVVDGSSGSNGEAQHEARERVRNAIASVHGNEAKQMVINVCCYGYALSDGTYNNYTVASSKMARFREALDDLAKFYCK